MSSSGPLTQYKTLVEQGKLKHDSYQEEVACKLDNLLDKLEEYERDLEEYHARRFITLVDELYNHHCCVYCSAAASIDELFQGTEEGTLFDLERQALVLLALPFEFETEMEVSKLRQDVLSPGIVSSGGSPTGIISMLSGLEEMFAFRRAVSRLIEMQTSVCLEGTATLHPYFQNQN